MIDKTKINRSTRILFKNLGELADQLEQKIYVVGGYVRDLVLGIDNKDIDFVVIGDALKFIKEFKKKYKTDSVVVYPKFGTGMLNYGSYKLEFVSARKELYMEESRKPEVTKADLISDLSRRDFTINALAMDISSANFGTIIDPFKSQDDIFRKVIKTPLEPDQTYAIKDTAWRLKIVSQERITDEFNKIMLAEKPSIGFKLLDSSGLLYIFLPELLQTKGVEQRNEYHHKDVFSHTLQVLDQLAKSTGKLELRLAAIFHDIAKPRTKNFDEKSGWTFYGHEIVGEKMTNKVLRRMKYSNHIINYVTKMVRLHLRPMTLVSDEVTDSAIRRLLLLAGDEFDDLMKLCQADITSKNPNKVKRYLHNYEIVLKKAKDVQEKDQLRAFKSPVDGNEIMRRFALKPGPQIGIIKKFIEEAILDGIIPNEHDPALKYMIEHKEELLHE